ncbi:hypothetical protein [Halomonas sp. SpR8]|uniref:hypothetical protein n=1 Tax=Halomonas sp. SpR8 TaxID=3050463 RepID=UPI0027E3C6B5|nr:hypothetical protein [Halomonas sp. SpR8]MDQ7727723.1 hypothetical protein [Halomonas sp. SpR8]
MSSLCCGKRDKFYYPYGAFEGLTSVPFEVSGEWAQEILPNAQTEVIKDGPRY